MSPIKKGQTVQFKPGIIDPDNHFPIGGWSGRVIDIYEDGKMLEVEFDSVTLINMPDAYIRQSIDAEYDYLHYSWLRRYAIWFANR